MVPFAIPSLIASSLVSVQSLDWPCQKNVIRYLLGLIDSYYFVVVALRRHDLQVDVKVTMVVGIVSLVSRCESLWEVGSCRRAKYPRSNVLALALDKWPGKDKRRASIEYL